MVRCCRRIRCWPVGRLPAMGPKKSSWPKPCTSYLPVLSRRATLPTRPSIANRHLVGWPVVRRRDGRKSSTASAPSGLAGIGRLQFGKIRPPVRPRTQRRRGQLVRAGTVGDRSSAAGRSGRRQRVGNGRRARCDDWQGRQRAASSSTTKPVAVRLAAQRHDGRHSPTAPGANNQTVSYATPVVVSDGSAARSASRPATKRFARCFQPRCVTRRSCRSTRW